jgi:hypothetical protein
MFNKIFINDDHHTQGAYEIELRVRAREEQFIYQSLQNQDFKLQGTQKQNNPTIHLMRSYPEELQPVLQQVDRVRNK